MNSDAAKNRARGTPAGIRIELVERLRSRRREIEEKVFARISNPWFDQTGSGDPEYVGGLRAAGVAAVSYALNSLEHWGELLAPAPAETVEQARRAARAGVGLDTVLRRYFAGRAVLETFVLQEAEHGVLRDQQIALGDVLRVISALTDRLTVAAGGAYREESSSLERPREPDMREAQDESRREDVAGSPGKPAGSCAHDQRPRKFEAPNGDVTGIARERILEAIVQVVAERGVAHASIGSVAMRAKVSRPTLYKVFPGGLDEGVTAVMDSTLEQVGALATHAFADHECWRDRMRAALAAGLAYFDANPESARVCLVETLGGSPVVLEHRARVVRAFRELIVAQIGDEVQEDFPLIAEAILASVMEMARERLMTEDSPPLIDLLGPLMALIVKYVIGTEPAIQEAHLSAELARAIQAGEVDWAPSALAPVEQEVALPATIAKPTARRLRECVLHLSEHPGVSNSAVGAALGIPHKSQVSRLLGLLHDEGVAVRSSAAPGASNEWRLSGYGTKIAQALTSGDVQTSQTHVPIE